MISPLPKNKILENFTSRSALCGSDSAGYQYFCKKSTHACQTTSVAIYDMSVYIPYENVYAIC